MSIGRVLLTVALALSAPGCAGPDSDRRDRARSSPDSLTSSPPSGPAPVADATPEASPRTSVPLRLETVVSDLDTVWSIAFDPAGRLWWTERRGRLGRVGAESRRVDGVVESGEGGLMGLAFDASGRSHLMYTGDDDNRVVRLDGERQTVLVDGIPKGRIHNGGRLRFGTAGELFVATGDTGDTSLPQRRRSLAGKVLRIDAGATTPVVHSRGHRNIQGLCLDPSGRLFATEHGPDRGDEVDVVDRDGDGGWPDDVGNGLRNYTPTIAPAGCAFYTGDEIPQWRGSMLFVTLKGQDLRRLTFAADGSVRDEEVLYDGELGRLRDVVVGPDGFVYLATSNRDGRGDASADRIVRIRPA